MHQKANIQLVSAILPVLVLQFSEVFILKMLVFILCLKIFCSQELLRFFRVTPHSPHGQSAETYLPDGIL